MCSFSKAKYFNIARFTGMAPLKNKIPSGEKKIILLVTKKLRKVFGREARLEQPLAIGRLHCTQPQVHAGKTATQNPVTVCPTLKVVHVSALMCIRKKMNFKYPFPLEKISSLKLCN